MKPITARTTFAVTLRRAIDPAAIARGWDRLRGTDTSEAGAGSFIAYAEAAADRLAVEAEEELARILVRHSSAMAVQVEFSHEVDVEIGAPVRPLVADEACRVLEAWAAAPRAQTMFVHVPGARLVVDDGLSVVWLRWPGAHHTFERRSAAVVGEMFEVQVVGEAEPRTFGPVESVYVLDPLSDERPAEK